MKYRNEVKGGFIHCPICGNDEFFTTMAATDVQMYEMKNTFYICQKCGCVTMFCKNLNSTNEKGGHNV